MNRRNVGVVNFVVLLSSVFLFSCVSREVEEGLASNQQLTRQLLNRVEYLEKENEGLRVKVNELSNQKAIRLPAGSSLTMEKRRSDATAGDKQTVADEFYKAQSLYQAGNIGEAEEAFRHFIDQYPNDELSIQAHFWLGDVYYTQRRCAQAIDFFDFFIKRLPEDEKSASAREKMQFCLQQVQGFVH